jgi:hypothetical protein
MKISLVIPSTTNHFKYVDCILKNYELGTVKPDEVIVSISNGHLLDEQNLKNIELKYKNSFEKLKFIINPFQVMEGPNRGIGSIHTSFDYITYHDSDDIPHPQRIEIIKHFFKNYDILHLNHSYTFSTIFEKILLNDIILIESEKIYLDHFGNKTYENRPLDYFPNPNDKSYGYNCGFPVCGGPTTIHKSVLDHISWNENRILSYDYDFCMDVLFKYKKSIIIDSPLIWYNKIGNADWAC